MNPPPTGPVVRTARLGPAGCGIACAMAILFRSYSLLRPFGQGHAFAAASSSSWARTRGIQRAEFV